VKKILQNFLQLLIGIPILAVVIYLLFFSSKFGIFRQSKSLSTLDLNPAPKAYIDTLGVYNLVNDYRASHGLTKLLLDPYMCNFAKKRLKQIHTDFTHVGYKREVLKTYCQQCRDSGENLAKGQPDESSIVQDWITSPEHLANITNPQYSLTCIVVDKYGAQWFAVQEFASNF